MNQRPRRTAFSLMICLSFALIGCVGASPLPWKPSFKDAVTSAKAEHRAIFLMISENGCAPCKMLEKSCLPDPRVREGLNDFIWYHANEEPDLNKKYADAFPTCLILDSNGTRVLQKIVGYGSVPAFLSFVMKAREASGLPLTPEMTKLKAVQFVPDYDVIGRLRKAGDVDALVKYLAPAKADYGREANYFIGKINFPAGVRASDAMVTSTYFPIPESGVLFCKVSRGGEMPFELVAKGCRKIERSVRVDEATAVENFTFNLELLNTATVASFSGRVLEANGRPVSNAIVRICDWNECTRTDATGGFNFAEISPGKFTVRAEAPGGEWQKELTFESGKKMVQDLQLRSVTTVGIRWTLQRQEGSLDLTGPQVETGEAYFSAQHHSRFDLHRGAEVRQYFGSDFMCSDQLASLEKFVAKENLPELKARPGQPFFWLFDSGMHPNGLHAETSTFDDLKYVNNNNPCGTNYFKFLRGTPIHKGQVYTLRCTLLDCYAKLEITDVTIVPR
jgi:thioredoxin-related protein